MLQAGQTLKATELMDDVRFKDAVIFIAEYNDDGAMGFVVNKIFQRKLNELQEFSKGKAFSLYSGGPVENEKLFFIHRRPDIIEGGEKITNGIYLGGNFDQAVDAINNDHLAENDLRIFIGYCGWDAGELEAEVGEGSWEEGGSYEL